jgi:hypothetical protein
MKPIKLFASFFSGESDNWPEETWSSSRTNPKALESMIIE